MTDILVALLGGVVTTLQITVGAFVLGAALGIPLALLRRSEHRVPRVVGATVIEVIRSVPPVVWLFLTYYGISIGMIRFDTLSAAVVGLGIVSAAYLAEIYRAALAAVPPGQTEGADALGLRRTTTLVRVLAPQALTLTVPPAATYAIGLLKDSALASIIGATDITFFAYQQSRMSNDGLVIFLLAAALYLILSLPIAVAARAGGSWLERRLLA